MLWRKINISLKNMEIIYKVYTMSKNCQTSSHAIFSFPPEFLYHSTCMDKKIILMIC